PEGAAGSVRSPWRRRAAGIAWAGPPPPCAGQHQRRAARPRSGWRSSATSVGFFIGGPGRFRFRVLVDDHVEGLAFLHHAHVAARPFFDGLQTGLQLVHFHRQQAIALPEALDLHLLLGNLPLQLDNLRQAALAYPEAILQGKQAEDEASDKPLHSEGLITQLLNSARPR